MLAVAAAGVLAGGGAYAAAFGGSPTHEGVVQVCYNESNGNMRLVSSRSDCRNHEGYLVLNVHGPKGDTGPQGPQGPAGPQGATGPQGADGTSVSAAVEAAGLHCAAAGFSLALGGSPLGFLCNGVQGLAGPKGDTGPAGATGPAGPQGEQGIQGPKGDTGPAGPAGPLAGTACTVNGHAGTTAISFDSGTGVGTITCAASSSCSPPAYPNGSVTCDSVGNYVYGCNAGWGDVNGDRSDGCEDNLLTDKNNCGAVGVSVSHLPNAAGECVNGQPAIVECIGDRVDIDGNAADGCEGFNPNEPNDTQAKAFVVPDNWVTTSDSIYPAGNDDWYSFDLGGCSAICSTITWALQGSTPVTFDVYTGSTAASATLVASNQTSYTVQEPTNTSDEVVVIRLHYSGQASYK
ncbi:MAG: hypothetical protein ACRDTP_00290, partial [Mycobacteriales bacterium]